jgi:DNA repair protein REV1
LEGETQAFLDTLTPELRKVVEAEVRAASKYPPVAPKSPVRPKTPSKPTTPKSTTPSKLRSPSVTPSKRGEKHNVKHITKQLATKRRIPISPAKSRFFDMFAAKAVKDVTEEELIALDIDPVVFVQLPPDLQKEQLSEQRYLKRNSSKLKAPEFQSARTSRASSRQRSLSVGPVGQSLLVAKFIKPPALRKKTTVEDIQDLIMGWVDAGSETGPELGEVEKFTSYILECLEGELGFAPSGLERVIGLMRWWRHLCRSHWSDAEVTLTSRDPGERQDRQWEDRSVGDRWWFAFCAVQEKIDTLVCKRFGGRLRL